MTNQSDCVPCAEEQQEQNVQLARNGKNRPARAPVYVHRASLQMRHHSGLISADKIAGSGTRFLHSRGGIVYDGTMRNHTLKRLAVRGGRAKVARRPQVTLRLPRRLYERAKLLVKGQQTGSVNEFIVKAV